ncbi:MAG: PLP-dependent aspartate aminotransferase family protein [Deltaproteobacteria bacterium]|nr:PLP-dependent aspartate aminotransferase family protein [Deltaproteobacteria bacterium]
MPKRDLSPATLAAQALAWPDPQHHGLVPSIHPSASYARAPDGSYPGGHSYSRDQNPTFDAPEALLAALEGGTKALLFASGMAAATTIFETLPPRAHVLVPRHMYWTIRGWLQALHDRGAIELEAYDNDDADHLASLLRKDHTALVWVETPSNPLGKLTDIETTVGLAHHAGAKVVADGTTATPVLCQPLSLGVDIVMHSATKQLNGHADVLAGALVTANPDDPMWQAIEHERGYRGAVLGPFEAWLLLRGMRTLFLRVPAACRGANRVAQMLVAHAGVDEVYYPGLPDHPGHDIARRQMRYGFGSMLSFRPAGGEARARAVMNRLNVFRDATSLGGLESLVEHRARIEGQRSPLPADLLRLSIGIEDSDDLIADLEQALSI